MHIDYDTFAQDWQDAWNSHDLSRILAHYRDDIKFTSQKAATLVGDGYVSGIAALEIYWSRALELQPDLHFQIEDIFRGHKMMVITYINHKRTRAAETLKFDENGLVYEASACHVD